MTLNLGPIEQATTKFFVFAKKFGKNVWQHSHDKRYTTFNLNTVRIFHCSVDIDYADTCWYSHWLRGHDVGVASLTMQIRCLHSHWLREQSHFEIEYLLRKQKISLNCFSLSIRAGAQTELLSKKRTGQKSRDTVPLRSKYFRIRRSFLRINVTSTCIIKKIYQAYMYILYVMEYNTQETVPKPKPNCTVYSPHNLRNEILSRRKNCSQDGAIIQWISSQRFCSFYKYILQQAVSVKMTLNVSFIV